MDNFSHWVRESLLEYAKEERKVIADAIKKAVLYGSYCEKCDITFENPHDFLMQSHYCTKCFDKCKYLGLIE